MKTKLLLTVLAVSGVVVSVYAGAVLATPAVNVTTATVAKAGFDPVNLRARSAPPPVWKTKIKTRGVSDLYVIDNTIAPGGTTGWHSHPGPSLIFVVAGTVTNYVSGRRHCKPREYSTGQGFVDEGGDSVHTLQNNGTVPARTIAVQFLPAGA